MNRIYQESRGDRLKMWREKWKVSKYIRGGNEVWHSRTQRQKMSSLSVIHIKWREEEGKHLSMWRQNSETDFILFFSCFILMILLYMHMTTEQNDLVCHTFLTVGFSIFHVKKAIPKRHLTSSTDKATCVPSLS